MLSPKVVKSSTDISTYSYTSSALLSTVVASIYTSHAVTVLWCEYYSMVYYMLSLPVAHYSIASSSDYGRSHDNDERWIDEGAGLLPYKASGGGANNMYPPPPESWPPLPPPPATNGK